MQLITINIYDEPVNVQVSVYESPPDEVQISVIECLTWEAPEDALRKSNFLGEFDTEEEKMQARQNLGVSPVEYGSKYSALDAGSLLDISIDDDFLYICVEAGTVGNARWKRTPLKQI